MVNLSSRGSGLCLGRNKEAYLLPIVTTYEWEKGRLGSHLNYLQRTNTKSGDQRGKIHPYTHELMLWWLLDCGLSDLPADHKQRWSHEWSNMMLTTCAAWMTVPTNMWYNTAPVQGQPCGYNTSEHHSSPTLSPIALIFSQLTLWDTF